jgi:hypothetical protein
MVPGGDGVYQELLLEIEHQEDVGRSIRKE